VAGCGREHVNGRALCWFHGNRLRRRYGVTVLSADELIAWISGQAPRLGVHQFSLGGVPELLRPELPYALQRRDEAPPPLDPTQESGPRRDSRTCTPPTKSQVMSSRVDRGPFAARPRSVSPTGVAVVKE
jgi:hypothetical protein